FNTVLEYPIMLIAALVALTGGGWAHKQRLWLYVALGALTIAAWAASSAPRPVMLALLAAPAIALFVMRDKGWSATIAAGCVWGIGAVSNPLSGGHTERSFFGVLKVVDIDGVRIMLHGTTLHGAQDLERPLTALTYYNQAAPIGQLFDLKSDAQRIGVIGLGAGSVACVADAHQSVVFYEIDPVVVRVAEDPRHFTFLDDCGDRTEIVLADGRLGVADAPEGAFDLLIVDAFSSNSVPVHLMTKEAVALYLSRLSPSGVLAMHVSNRNMALDTATARIMDSLDAPALVQRYRPGRGEGRRVFDTQISDVVIAARNEAALSAFVADPRWEPLQSDNGRPWTDDYSNIIGALLDDRES
ncbi:MAG: fused MFS/spermidine synthase, partial [Pseudomonadota bacterium]